jgi:hypothetical protein
MIALHGHHGSVAERLQKEKNLMQTQESNQIGTAMPLAMAKVPNTEAATVFPAKKDRAYFASKIETAAVQFYRSAKFLADILLEARLVLSPEEFEKFISEDCKFDYSFVCKLIKMAADYRLNDPANEELLPEAWTVRYEIMLMKEDTFRMGVNGLAPRFDTNG